VSELLAVVNASPLIYLGRLGLLDLLPRLFAQILTVEDVKQEVLKDTSAPETASMSVAFSSWLHVLAPTDNTLVSKLLAAQAHRGEAAVIALAKQLAIEKREPVVILDDLLARELATTLGLRVTGTIGVLLKAGRQGLLKKGELRSYIRRLVEDTDFRMSVKLYSRILSDIERMEG